MPEIKGVGKYDPNKTFEFWYLSHRGDRSSNGPLLPFNANTIPQNLSTARDTRISLCQQQAEELRTRDASTHLFEVSIGDSGEIGPENPRRSIYLLQPPETTPQASNTTNWGESTPAGEDLRDIEGAIGALLADYQACYEAFNEGSTYGEPSMKAIQYELVFLLCRELHRLDSSLLTKSVHRCGLDSGVDQVFLKSIESELKACAAGTRDQLTQRDFKSPPKPSQEPRFNLERVFAERETWFNDLPDYFASLRQRSLELMKNVLKIEGIMALEPFNSEAYQHLCELRCSLYGQVESFLAEIRTRGYPGRYIAGTIHAIIADWREPFPVRASLGREPIDPEQSRPG